LTVDDLVSTMVSISNQTAIKYRLVTDE